MATMPFTYPWGQAGHVFMRVEGVAQIGCDGIEEVALEAEDGQIVTVGGQLEQDIIVFLGGHPYYAPIVYDLTEAECAGRIAHDREVGRAA